MENQNQNQIQIRFVIHKQIFCKVAKFAKTFLGSSAGTQQQYFWAPNIQSTYCIALRLRLRLRYLYIYYLYRTTDDKNQLDEYDNEKYGFPADRRRRKR